MTAAVVFDLDDTLYSERSFAYSGFLAVAAAFRDVLGVPEQAAAEARALFETAHRPRVFNELLVRRGLPPDPQLIARMVQSYREHRPAIALYPDADEILSKLRIRMKLGLISDGPARQQWSKIDALGLRERLDSIVITSELAPDANDVAPPMLPPVSDPVSPGFFSKPHSAAFERTADQLGVAHAACVYVADNPLKDFIAPNKLKWLTVQIRRSDGLYRNATAPPGGTAHHRIKNLGGLSDLLARKDLG